MKNRLIFVLLATGLLLSAGKVVAQNKIEAGDNKAAVETIRQEEREEIRQEVGTAVETGEKTREEAREGVRMEEGESLKEIRVESLKQVRQTRQETRENIERIREENRGLIEQRRLALKEQLGLLQNEEKAEIVERIYDNLNRLNDQIVTRLLVKIDQIEEVLERVKSRTDKVQEAGLDVSGVREAIVVAEEAIENARAAAETQAGNVYEITIGDEASLRTDIKPVRDQLQSDLEALRQKVVLAREAVREAITTLAQVRGIEGLEISPSAGKTE
jgi:hypothetical protein